MESEARVDDRHSNQRRPGKVLQGRGLVNAGGRMRWAARRCLRTLAVRWCQRPSRRGLRNWRRRRGGRGGRQIKKDFAWLLKRCAGGQKSSESGFTEFPLAWLTPIAHCNSVRRRMVRAGTAHPHPAPR